MSHLRATIVQHWRQGQTAGTARGRLYVKADCELCDSARELLRHLEQSGRLRVEIVDIATDRNLLLRYGLSIPVLEVEGGPCLNWPFDQLDLKRALP